MQLFSRTAQLLRDVVHAQGGSASTEQPRPPGFLIWFQIANEEQGCVALPLICRCVQGLSGRSQFQVLVTANQTVCTFLRGTLPEQVKLLETTPSFVHATDSFLRHWMPQVAILMDSDLQPSVLSACREHGVWMAWLDAKMPVPHFLRHQGSQRSRAAVSKLLNMFDLVLPETDTDVARLLMLGGALTQMPAWYVELSYAQALEACALLAKQSPSQAMTAFHKVKVDRPALLVANSTLEESMVGVPELHCSLRETFSSLLTVIVPKEVTHAKQVHAKLHAQGLAPVMWSQLSQDLQMEASDVQAIVVDVAGTLPQLYQAIEVVLMGDSLAEDARGSRLHEAAAAGCTVVAGPCTALFLEVADLNQAALRAAQDWPPMGPPHPNPTSGEDALRPQNPTPRRAAGETENAFGLSTSSTLARIRTVPEEEAVEEADDIALSEGRSMHSMTAPASLSQNWRFSPISSPSTSSAEAAAALARSSSNAWQRTTSLRRTGSSSADGSFMAERSMATLDRVPLSVLLRRSGSNLSGQARVSDDTTPSPLYQDENAVFVHRWPTLRRYQGQPVLPVWQLPQNQKGPAVWQAESPQELKEALQLLLAEPLQRRSQGNAAVQAAAKIGNGMLTIAWEVFVIMVLEPALAQMTPRAQAQAAQAANTSSKTAAVSRTVSITADSSNSHSQASEAVPA